MKIEKGIIIPPSPREKGGGKWQNIVNQMEVGDSVFFSKKDFHCRGSFCRAINATDDFKAVTRASDNGGVRIWKVKKNKGRTKPSTE